MIQKYPAKLHVARHFLVLKPEVGQTYGKPRPLSTVHPPKSANCPKLLDGMSHMDEVDFRRRPLRGRDGPVDPAERYAALVAGLRERGL